MMRMTETSRDDEHSKDVMVQLMFGMLCPTEDEARMWGCHCPPEAPIVRDNRHQSPELE